MISAVLFGTFFLMLVLNVPIGISIGISALSTTFFVPDIGLSSAYVSQNLVTALDSFTLMAIPFFILAGELMATGGISKRLLDVFSAFFGRVTGGLAIVTVVACMFFAAISGSAPATVAAIGGMVIPSMLKQGYDKKFILGLIAAAGCVGVIIPPSIPMVIYSTSTSQSITKMFMAGFIPGILIGVGLIVVAVVISHQKGYKSEAKPFNLKETLAIIGEGKWALLSPVIVLGGIYGGIFTPTEAAGISVAYSFIVGVFIYKELKFRELFGVFCTAGLTSGTILIVMGCATAFTKILTIANIPQQIAQALLTFTDSAILLLLLINIVLLFVGCFMDTACSIMILSPIFLPIITSFGIDPIHFGIIMVVNLAIGFVTPPLGINLFVATRVGGSDIGSVIKGVIPFLVTELIILVLITYIPAISLFLPQIMG